MSTRGDILRRAAQVEPGAVPEPWGPSDDEEALATVSDREHYRKNLLTLPDGAGEVPAYVWDFPRTPTIPDEVREEWTRGSAGRVLNAQGQFVSRGSDVPRLLFDGDEAGLLVEEAGRTNQIPKSSQISKANWDGSFDIASETKVDSILEEKNAYKITGAGNRQANVNKKNVGTFTGGTETVEFIIEKGTSGKVGGEVRNSDTGNNVVKFRYDWGTDTLTVASGSAQRMNTRRTAGPNGNPLVFLTVSYSAGNAENTSGDTRRLFANVDTSGSASNSIWHHAQLEEAPNASSPIVTGGSPVTRSGDDYSIFEGGQPPWWNPNEGTFVMNLEVRSFFNKPAPAPLTLNPEDDRIFVAPGGPPYSVFFRDKDGNDASINSIASPYQSFGLALSLTSSEARLSVNGSSDIIVYDGNGLGASEVSLTRSAALYSFGKIIYTPRALPEPTLNQITS